MLRSSKRRLAPLYAVVLSTLVLGALFSPANAGGGKRPFGEVTSFDGTMLTISMGNGGTLVAPIADDVKIKVSHRSNKGHAKHAKKPSNGTVADLVAGAKVMRIKVFCQEVVKLRIVRAPSTATTSGLVTVATEGEDAEADEDETDDNPCDDDDDDDVETDEDGTVTTPGTGDVPDGSDDDTADDDGDGTHDDEDDDGLLPALPL